MAMNREKLIDNMTDNLPVLRAKLNMTQEDLANKIGLSRGTIISIENNKRTMTWSTFMSLVLLFSYNEKTNKLLEVMDIFTEDLHKYLEE
ncbi:MAG: helix-turn-helix transcriptional regulator [Ruminococcaceae bacterium]|nr:helix-turn-helix transcriptional regulator [Oscillospiraceae bacterium]